MMLRGSSEICTLVSGTIPFEVDSALFTLDFSLGKMLRAGVSVIIICAYVQPAAQNTYCWTL